MSSNDGAEAGCGVRRGRIGRIYDAVSVSTGSGVSRDGESPCPMESFEIDGRGGNAILGGRLEEA